MTTATTTPAAFEIKVYIAGPSAAGFATNPGHTLAFYTETRRTAKAAERFAVEEMKYESTVRVVCEALGIDVEGDFVGVAHPADLYANQAATATAI